MKRYSLMAVFVVGVFLICLAFSACLAQAQEDTGFSWGIVKSVSSEKITIGEYDYNTYEEVDATYSLDPNLVIQNAASVSDIKVGDGVEIDYIVRDGKRIAQIIAVEEASYEESDYPEEDMEY